jgi:hypothetical protein
MFALTRGKLSQTLLPREQMVPAPGAQSCGCDVKPVRRRRHQRSGAGATQSPPWRESRRCGQGQAIVKNDVEGHRRGCCRGGDWAGRGRVDRKGCAAPGQRNVRTTANPHPCADVSEEPGFEVGGARERHRVRAAAPKEGRAHDRVGCTARQYTNDSARSTMPAARAT